MARSKEAKQKRRPFTPRVARLLTDLTEGGLKDQGILAHLTGTDSENVKAFMKERERFSPINGILRCRGCNSRITLVPCVSCNSKNLPRTYQVIQMSTPQGAACKIDEA
jgi:hypothetical protein